MSPSAAGVERLARAFDIDFVDATIDDVEEFLAVGLVVELMGTIAPGGGRRLDQQMRPVFVIGVGRQVEAGREPSTPEGEISLRVRSRSCGA